MSDSQAEDVDGGADPAIFLEKQVVQTALLLLHLLGLLVVMLHEFDQVGLKLKQADGQGHDFEIHVLDDDFVGRSMLFGSHEYI